MANLCLTIPVVLDAPQGKIKPTPDDMMLESVNPRLLYGFHGGDFSKGAILRSIYLHADRDGAVTRGKRLFYMVDLTLSTLPSFDDSQLLGRLPDRLLDKVPFLITKRASVRVVEILAELWAQWAKDTYGLRTVHRADVDWANPLSFMPAFPDVAENLFVQFPKLRCAVIPMYVRNPTGGKKIAWVGVLPRDKAAKWVREANARMQPEIKIDLRFSAQ